MGWFKSQKEFEVEKINKLLNEFNITHKYISNDGKTAMVLDDVNQILGYIQLDWGSGELETMRYNEIEAIDFSINHLSVSGVIDIENLNKKETEEFVGIIKRDITSAINSTELFYQIGLSVETVLQKKEFPIYFFFSGTGKPPASKSKELVKLSIERYIEFVDLLCRAFLKTKEDQ